MKSRQQGTSEVRRRFIASLPPDTKVVIIGKDHPRPPFLGSPFDMIGHPILSGGDSASMTMALEGLLPFYKTRMSGREESMNGELLEAISKTAEARVDIPASKPNWRKNRMGFLDGLNRKKNHGQQGND